MSDEDPGDEGGPDDEELAALADDLSTVLRELRDELRASREAGGEPVERPPTREGPELSVDLPSATDVLAFTDERLIPAAITILEVNIRALELLQKGIRWARPDRAGENARAVRSHAESVSRSTLQRLDGVLADLQEAAGEGALPENAEASGVITEARRLRDEIDTALEERAEARDEEPAELPDEDDEPPSPWDEPPEVDVDVEGELESIKAELGKDEDAASGEDDEGPPAADDEKDGGPPAADDEDADGEEGPPASDHEDDASDVGDDESGEPAADDGADDEAASGTGGDGDEGNGDANDTEE